jgi:multidrug efflux system membrane fusion protein
VARHRVPVISAIIVALAGGWFSPGHAVAVTMDVAAKQDLPIYLTGLRGVQASFTVAIRPQVDGKLEQVLFAKIDPRRYQAALDQAKARKAQDDAQLISAQKNLHRSRTLVDKSFQTQQVVDQQQAKVDQLIASIEVQAS